MSTASDSGDVILALLKGLSAISLITHKFNKFAFKRELIFNWSIFFYLHVVDTEVNSLIEAGRYLVWKKVPIIC